MGKPVFCICENKGADQLQSNCAADQRLCFRYTDSTIPLLSKPEISSLQQASVSDLVGNFGERFCRITAHLMPLKIAPKIPIFPQKKKNKTVLC